MIELKVLFPYWVLEFHDIKDKTLFTGLCYLLAMTYTKQIAVYSPITEALNELNESFELEDDEFADIVNGMLQLNPSIRSEIQSYYLNQ